MTHNSFRLCTSYFAVLFIVSSKFLGSVMQPTLSRRLVALYRLVLATLCDGLHCYVGHSSSGLGWLSWYTRSLTGTQDATYSSFIPERDSLFGWRAICTLMMVNVGVID